MSDGFVETDAINLFAPEEIKITDEANDLLVELCQVTGLGKSRAVDVAIRIFASRYLDGDSEVLLLIEQSKNNRSFSETVSDILHNAIDKNKQQDKK